MGCCAVLNGIIKDCEANIGGIKRAYIACADNVGEPTIDGASEEITEIPTPVDEWHEFEFRKQTGSVTTTVTKDDTTGSLYYESNIILQFAKQETAKRIEINSLAVSDVKVIIEDNNGKFWYFGLDNSVTLIEGSGETGTAYGDLNGYNITLQDVSLQLPYEITSDAMDALLNPEPEPEPQA